MRQYRSFKARRRTRDMAERNSGFWTDRRLFEAEYALMSLWLGVPWTMIVLAVATNHRLEFTYLAMLGYPIGVYLLVFGLNMPVNNRAQRQAGRRREKPGG